MANVNDLFYHGVRQQIRRVLTALGPERIDKGLTAFEDGASSWSECFFARALGGHTSELLVMKELDLPLPPVRITWNLFDQFSSPMIEGKDRVSGKMVMTKKEFRRFIEDVLDESRSPEVMQLIRSVSQADLEKEVHCG